MATDTEALRQQLEPYRGRGKVIYDEQGVGGLSALATLCGNSPAAAAEFLGLDRSTLQTWFGIHGIPVVKGNTVQARERKETICLEAMSPEERIAYYEKVTSAPEWAPVYHWRLPKTEEFGICVGISDLHYQRPDCDVARFRRLIEWLQAHKHARWIFAGDMFETKCSNSPGKEETIFPLQTAKRDMIWLLKPVAKQGIMMLSGNHDARPARGAGIEVTTAVEEVARELGIYYGGYNKMLRIVMQSGHHRQQYDGYVSHGSTGSRTAGGKRNALHKLMQNIDGDFAIMGHVHDKLADELLRMGLSEETVIGQEDGREYARVVFNEKALAICGSYLKYMAGGYAREADMSPSSLGNVSLHFYAKKKNIHAWK